MRVYIPILAACLGAAAMGATYELVVIPEKAVYYYEAGKDANWADIRGIICNDLTIEERDTKYLKARLGCPGYEYETGPHSSVK